MAFVFLTAYNKLEHSFLYVMIWFYCEYMYNFDILYNIDIGACAKVVSSSLDLATSSAAVEFHLHTISALFHSSCSEAEWKTRKCQSIAKTG